MGQETGRDKAISTIHGNIKGIRASDRKALERTYRRRVPVDEVVTPELARHLCSLSRALSRQVGVLIARDGSIQSVIVGDATHLMIPEIGRLRGGAGRFRGLRLVHTHLRNEGLTQDDLNDLVLLRLDMVAMVSAGPNGDPGRFEAAHLLPGVPEKGTGQEGGWTPFRRIEARSVHTLDFDFDSEIRSIEAELSRVQKGRQSGEERAIVVAITPDDDHLHETLELVRSSGVTIAAVARQKRAKVHPRTVVGSGKLQEIVLESMRQSADVAVFDIDLKPAQARAFEDATGLKAIDRTQLILDIFAQRAESRDGKLQVELAQLKYSLPRLTEKDAGLSRLVGGIGGRGPGETVLEIGRRRIRDRIRTLERKIQGLSQQRHLRRQRRRRERVPTLSIVGYTNAGKSTLLNALTKSRVASADRLFMTLDPTSRRLRFPKEGEVVITDTVGFLHDLPEDLVNAFRATLEELQDADLLLHVVDASDQGLESKVEAVHSLLSELHLDAVPRLMLLNKSDRLETEQVRALCRRFQGIAISATEKTGLKNLVAVIEQHLGRLGAQRRATFHPAASDGGC